jgi:glycosyltransferase involved in cell wall biosynthesis
MDRFTDICELLDSIKVQTYPNIEIIFVVERTQELVEKIKMYVNEKSIQNIKVIFNDGEQGQSPARNYGVKYANGDIVGFIDDDVVLFPNWAEEMVKTYTDDSIIGVTGSALPLWEDESLSWFPKEFYWIISCTAWFAEEHIKEVRSAWGMNMSFRKEAFKYCLFSKTFGHIAKEKSKSGLVVDDAEFSINLRLKTGKKILFNPSVCVKHHVYSYRLSAEFIRTQSYWQGYSKAILKKAYPNDVDTRGLMREETLLGRILFRLYPQTLALFFSNPRQSLKILSLSNSVLFYVVLGYISGVFHPLDFTKNFFK